MSFVPRAVFLLGPDHWDDGYDLPAPRWVERLLGGLPEPFTPKDLRRVIAARILEESGGRVTGVIMDRKDQQEGEDDADFFHRLEQEYVVEAYHVIFPMHGKVLGTVFEGGMLRRDFHYGKNPRIAIFAEDGFAKEHESGDVVFLERGKRTHYLEALAHVAEHVQFWSTVEDLVDVAVSWALAHDL